MLGRVPSGTAVLMTVEAGSSYAATIKKTAAAIDLKEIGIAGLRIKKATNGSMLLQISRTEGAKTEALVKKASAMFGSRGGCASHILSGTRKSACGMWLFT